MLGMNLDASKVYKVFHTLWYRGKNEGIFITELVSQRGKWYFVYDWQVGPDGKESPGFLCEVDPLRLKPAKCDAYDFMIEMPVKFPEHPELTGFIEAAKSRKSKG